MQRNSILHPGQCLSNIVRICLYLIFTLFFAGCGFSQDILSFSWPFSDPTPTYTPTPSPTPTHTPEPTPTPKPGETPKPSTPTPVPTPQVTIPNEFTKLSDRTRGYSLAIPSGWTEIDLRGSQIANLASMVGQGQALADLQEFLSTGAGQAVGMVAITDIGSAMFGGLPTLLNVSVVDAPDRSADDVLNFLTETIESNADSLGDVDIHDMNTAIINNMPGVRGSATVDLSNIGMNASIFVKVAGLIANDKVYVLTLATQDSNMAGYEPIFEQIIGTFRPE